MGVKLKDQTERASHSIRGLSLKPVQLRTEAPKLEGKSWKTLRRVDDFAAEKETSQSRKGRGATLKASGVARNFQRLEYWVLLIAPRLFALSLLLSDSVNSTTDIQQVRCLVEGKYL